MGQRTVVENRPFESMPSDEGDVVASRKASLDASVRTDEASKDLAVQFLWMSRAARRAIATQYELADAPPAYVGPEERSPLTTVLSPSSDRRHSSFESSSLSNLPYRPKDPLHNPRKHCRGSPSVDILEGRPAQVEGRRCKRTSGDSGYGTDTRRHPNRTIDTTGKQQTDLEAASVLRKPLAYVEDCAEDEGEVLDGTRRYARRHTVPTNILDTNKPSFPGQTASTQRQLHGDEHVHQAKGLRRMRGTTTLRPENPADQQRHQRPSIRIPVKPSKGPSNESLVLDSSPRLWPWTPTSTTLETPRSAARRNQLPVAESLAFGSAWSANTSRSRSAIFPPIEEHSDSATESDDDSSIESSILSIPASPIETHQLHPDDPLAPHLDGVVTKVLRQFVAHQAQQLGEQSNRRNTQKANSSTPDSSRKSRKRSHTNDPDQGPSPSDPNAPPDFKRPKIPSPTTAGKSLACPFWKKDPENHRHCYKKVLSRIKYVKQHLYKFHEAPISCACCGAEFPDEADRDEHLRARRCQVVERGPPSEGLSRAQRLEVSRRANPKDTEEEQWFVIWDIVFPGCPRPTSAYVDNDLSQDLCGFREFYTGNGPDILLDYLDAYDPGYARSVERRIAYERVVLGQALDRIYDQWAARRGLRVPPPPADVLTPPRTEPSNATDSDRASHVSLAYGAPLGHGPMLYSYVTDDVLAVPASNLQFVNQGLEGLGPRDDVYFEADPRGLMADLDNMFAAVPDEEDYNQGFQGHQL